MRHPLLSKQNYLLSLFSHCGLAIPQLVLQADWQEVWHSPHPPFFALSQRLRVWIVSICFIIEPSVFSVYLFYHILQLKSILLRQKMGYLPLYSVLSICAISSGDSLQPSLSHSFIIALNPFLKNSM